MANPHSQPEGASGLTSPEIKALCGELAVASENAATVEDHLAIEAAIRDLTALEATIERQQAEIERLAAALEGAVNFGTSAYRVKVRGWTTHSSNLHLEAFGGSLGLLKLTIEEGTRSVPVENGPERCTTITLYELRNALAAATPTERPTDG